MASLLSPVISTLGDLEADLDFDLSLERCLFFFLLLCLQSCFIISICLKCYFVCLKGVIQSLEKIIINWYNRKYTFSLKKKQPTNQETMLSKKLDHLVDKC